MSKCSSKGKICIKITFIIISVYVSFTKSLVNGAIGQNIIILDQLEALQIKTLPLLMYFYCSSDRFCGIYKRAVFAIPNLSLYEYRYIIQFAVSNTGWIESVRMYLLTTNDISNVLLGFIAQNVNQFSLVYCYVSGEETKFLYVI
eukprot:130002_1